MLEEGRTSLADETGPARSLSLSLSLSAFLLLPFSTKNKATRIMWDSVSLLEQCLGVLFNAHQFLPLSLFVDVSLSLLLREALLLEPRIITDPSPLPFVVSFAALCRIQPIRVPSSSPFECFNRAVSRVQDSALSIRQNRPDYTDHRGSDRPIVSSR